MATVFQQPAGQPMSVPPGVAPQIAAAPGMPAMAPGSVMYYPQMAGGGAVIMPMVATQPPNYEYTPNDFMVLSLVTVIVCGIFSPLTLLLSLPALFFSQQSRKSAVNGAIKVAKKQGMIAAYLNVTAIIAALLVACLVVGLALGLYGPVYTRNRFCSDYGNGYYGSSYSYTYDQQCR